MSKLNILYGGLTAILAVVFLLTTFSFPSEQRGLDPRVYPRFISICFFALSVGLIASGVRSSKKEEEKGKEARDSLDAGGALKEGAGNEGVAQKGRQGLKVLKEAFFMPARKRIWGMFILSLGYVAIIDTVGYLVATLPFLAGSMVLFGERKVWKFLLVSLVTTAVLFGLFRIIFRVPLPVSSLW